MLVEGDSDLGGLRCKGTTAAGYGEGVGSGGRARTAASSTTPASAVTAASAADAESDNGGKDKHAEDRAPAASTSRNSEEQKTSYGDAPTYGEELIQWAYEGAAGG